MIFLCVKSLFIIIIIICIKIIYWLYSGGTIFYQARAVLINAGQANAATVSLAYIARWFACTVSLILLYLLKIELVRNVYMHTNTGSSFKMNVNLLLM